MTTTAALVQLAAELTLFVVAIAGAALSSRSGLLGLDRTARLLLTGGLVALAGSAVAVGALVVERTDAPVALAAVRVGGAVVVALGALRWEGSRAARPTLLAGVVLLVGASVVESREVDLGPGGVGAEALVLVAALVMGAALVLAGRRTIPGRIGTSVAGILLLVVLLVSSVLSAVVSRTLEDDAGGRDGDRARAEAVVAPDVDAREDLDRALFVVVAVAGILGMALAIVVGERIGGAVRRLTDMAARIREGDLTARAAVDRDDELGELSTTLDSMAASVHHLADDLRETAAEEGRLRSRLESVFAGVTEAVVAADAERRVTDLNLAAADLLGLADTDSALGRPLDQVVELRGLDGHPLSLSAPRQRPRLVAGQVHRRDPVDGRVDVPVVGSVATLHGRGDGRAGVVVVLRDVRREQALEAAKQDFLANIGHELRTPLTPIKGYAGVLRRRTPTPEQARDWADGIAAGVDRLEHMVDRLVTFAAVTAGPGAGATPTDEEIEPAALVGAVVHEWRPRLGSDRAIEVVGADAPDLPAVRGDAAHLRLTLGELIDNAARFSAAGRAVQVGVERIDDADGAAVAFVVTDEGGGDLQALDAVVAAFVQGEASATRGHGGLGLGLALTDRVARAHGGRLVLTPSREGTTASVVVPTVGPRPRRDDRGR